MIRSMTALAFGVVMTVPVMGCDLVLPQDLVGKRIAAGQYKAAGWNAFDFKPKAMIDGKLLYRHVKHFGMPFGAGEQKLLAEHVGRAVTLAYGGKATGVKIVESATAKLDSKGAPVNARQYSVSVNRAGNPAPLGAGVVLRVNPARNDIALIVVPIDPDSPGDDPDHTLKIARAVAAQPGFDCAAGDMP